MDNDNANDTAVTPAIPEPPVAPKTQSLGEFIESLAEVGSNLRKVYRLSENGAYKLIDLAMQYDLRRRDQRMYQATATPEVNSGDEATS